MTGGLVQIAVYGSEDIFLTSNPHITFFKIIHRRYTNFAIETIQQHFTSTINFGQESTSIIEKMGDLMSKMYLIIDLPKVNLTKNYMNPCQKDVQLPIIERFFKLVNEYISSNIDLIRKIHNFLQTDNLKLNDIKYIINHQSIIVDLQEKKSCLINFIDQIKNFQNYFKDDKFIFLQKINQIDTIKIFNLLFCDLQKSGSMEIKSTMLKYIETIMYDSVKSFCLDLNSQYSQIMDSGNGEKNLKFAWVEELGHAIIDMIDIRIGDQIIDRQTGDWLILYNKLFLRECQTENYSKMIGNVEDLISFDANIKNNYKLIIPLQFWFCRFIGLALPIISLRYHDVNINLKLKDLSKLCYLENCQNFSNLQKKYDLNVINACLYVDYVYLDSDERKRFAQSSHEYLIETIQFNEFDDISGIQNNIHLNFAHPTKFIIWFCQPMNYRENENGNNKCQWNNYGVNSDKTGHTIQSCYLRINSYDRTDPAINPQYYNYMQPYLHFEKSPTDGLYVYSFAIVPMEHQPTGSINLSRIDDLSLVLKFTNDVSCSLEKNLIKNIYVGVYVMSYNILRFMSGMAGLAFQNVN